MMSSNTLKLCHRYYCEQFVIKILNILQSEYVYMKTLNICWDFIKLSSDDLQPCHCCCCEHCVLIRRQSNIQKYSKCFNLSGHEIKTNRQEGIQTNACSAMSEQ